MSKNYKYHNFDLDPIHSKHQVFVTNDSQNRARVNGTRVSKARYKMLARIAKENGEGYKPLIGRK